MNQTITEGRINVFGAGNDAGHGTVEWELRDEGGSLVFSASGNFIGGNKSSAGQCLDTMLEVFPHDDRLRRIVAVWAVYHLNDMKAGLPEQERAVAEFVGKTGNYDYTVVCQYLRTIDLYELPVPEGIQATGGFPADVLSGERGYRYGERWVYSAIPGKVIEEIKSWEKWRTGK